MNTQSQEERDHELRRHQIKSATESIKSMIDGAVTVVKQQKLDQMEKVMIIDAITQAAASIASSYGVASTQE